MKALATLLVLVAGPAAARTSLGSFDGWGAFRDEGPTRCFAIAQPVRRASANASFATVSTWPQARVRGQFYAQLSRARRADAPLTLIVGDHRFGLTGSGTNAWATDPRSDAAIVAAMRSASQFTIVGKATTGGGFADTYLLKGAATAIDAAALGCARR